MIITALETRGGRIKGQTALPESFSFYYPTGNLWELAAWLDAALILNGIMPKYPGGGGPTQGVTGAVLDRCQVTSFYVCDQATFNRELAQRREDGQFVCGGLWYAEITVNGTPTDCSFNTLPELLQIVWSIICRECRPLSVGCVESEK